MTTSSLSPRRHLAALPPYTPVLPFDVRAAQLGRTPETIVKLDANENPYGPSPLARRALADLRYAHIYPDPESRALRQALAEFVDVPADHLLAGAGADELIDLLMRVMLEPGDKVLTCPPTFGMYAFDARLNAAQIVEVSRALPRSSTSLLKEGQGSGEAFSLDLDAIRRAVEEHRPKLLFLATPNNPDGSLPSPEILDALLDLPTLVVLDEAYIEFADEALGRHKSRIMQVPQRDNLIVLRTFSKWAGLAGLRVGYGAFPSWLMPTLWKAKQPYNVNVAAQEAARATLRDLEERQLVVAHLRYERERLYRGLQTIPYLEPYPSQANFILCRVVGKDAAALRQRLAEEFGILVRYFAKPGLEDHIRISVGRPQDTDRVLEALEEIANEGIAN
ncbi:MAG: histidinol-phosphate transaminase [Chloroflexi bacterium]|nr:histidinol-phosphate transaminase [Chloroflexota bacterium]